MFREEFVNPVSEWSGFSAMLRVIYFPREKKYDRELINFVAANEAFERAASVGLLPNMILYLTRVYGLETASAANAIFLWQAASNFTPIIGAYLADSYVGRYRMIGFGCIVSLLVNFSIRFSLLALFCLGFFHLFSFVFMLCAEKKGK